MKSVCRHFRRALPRLRQYTGGMGLRIRQLRKARGLTQALLAEKAGISRSQLAEIETERKPANTIRLASIARALDVDVEDLFDYGEADSYRRVILDLMRLMDPEDRAALLRHAEALAGRKKRQD